MRVTRSSGFFLLGLAAFASNGCKEQGRENTTVETVSPLSSESNPEKLESGRTDGSLKLQDLAAQQELPAAVPEEVSAATSAASITVLEKTDRFGNIYRLVAMPFTAHREVRQCDEASRRAPTSKGRYS